MPFAISSSLLTTSPAFDEGRKDVECAPADGNDLVGFVQRALGGAQLEWTEQNPRCAR
jgi:hypothetical protein